MKKLCTKLHKERQETIQLKETPTRHPRKVINATRNLMPSNDDEDSLPRCRDNTHRHYPMNASRCRIYKRIAKYNHDENKKRNRRTRCSNDGAELYPGQG